MENRYNFYLTLLFFSLVTLSAKAQPGLSGTYIINPQCYLHWVQMPKPLIELNPQLTTRIQYGQTISHWDNSFQNAARGQTIHLHNCSTPFPPQTQSIESRQLPKMVRALWQDSLSMVPRLEALSPDLLAPLNQIAMVVSGGTPTSYSRVIQQNHLAWAYARQVLYRHYELSPVTQGEKTSTGTFDSLHSEPIPETIRQFDLHLNKKQRYWAKIAILKQALEDNNVPENQWLAWIDNDIVINDFLTMDSMLDRAIERYGKDFSLLVVKEGTKSRTPFNTGIILLRNTTIGRRLIDELWHLSSHPVHGYLGQEKTFHEQEALKIIPDYHPTYAMIQRL